MPKNPHGCLMALDPPRTHPPRRWRCEYCGLIGLLDEVRLVECTHVYPPCKTCGGTPECLIDCDLLRGLLEVAPIGLAVTRGPSAPPVTDPTKAN